METKLPKDRFEKEAKMILRKIRTKVENKENYQEWNELFNKKNYTEIFSRYYSGTKDSEGNWGYFYNPNAKWDWYSVGGRWSNSLKMKDRKKITTENYGNAPFFLNSEKKYKKEFEKKRAEGWCDTATKGELDFDAMKKAKTIPTFAVVKNGEWYERGSMGWWGIVSDEKDDNKWNKEFTKLLKGLSDDTLLTIVDCHI